MKQQLVFAAKLLALASAYLFTRSHTPPAKRRAPEKSLAVLFLLENLKRVVLHNALLIRDVKAQVEILQNDVALFKAFIKDVNKIRRKDEELEQLVRLIEDVVVEGESAILAFRNQELENRARNFVQRALIGSIEVIGVAKEVRAVTVKVKSVYERSRIVFDEMQRRKG